MELDKILFFRLIDWVFYNYRFKEFLFSNWVIFDKWFFYVLVFYFLRVRIKIGVFFREGEGSKYRRRNVGMF